MLLKVASRCEKHVDFFSLFGDCQRFFDRRHALIISLQKAIIHWPLKPGPKFGKLGFFRRALYARR
jgi:hypothetical protein